MYTCITYHYFLLYPLYTSKNNLWYIIYIYINITDQNDADSDGVGDVCDNCPSTSNAPQTDSDEDGIGDDCEDGELFQDK